MVFCIMEEPYLHGEDRRRDLQNLIIKKLGEPLAPPAVLFERDLPKTQNAKWMGRTILSADLGSDPGDVSSMVNPEAVVEVH